MEQKKTSEKVLVNLKGLQELLSCGRFAAEAVAEEAGASVRIGSRHLYSVQKIKDYVERIAE